ncbi:MAG: hypothetical protein AB8G05_08505 [Oligoflexales bacterium]
MSPENKHVNEKKNLQEVSVNSGEAGVASLLTVIILFGVTFSIFSFLSLQSDRQLKQLLREELKVDKLLVNRALAFQANCAAISSFTCSGAGPLKVDDIKGNDLIVNSGNKKIGKWNTRIRCVSDEYEVQVARLKSPGVFETDPFTNQPDSWESIGNLESLCVRERQVIAGTPCYGADTGGLIGSAVGRTVLPAEVLAACNSTSPPCQFKGKPSDPLIKHGGFTYCPDSLESFPTCPAGFHAELEYVDRYGWGGIDYTKFTICIQG